jgi:C4-type Zn-finger protein
VIAELDLELDHGTLGSMYSTLEGLLEKIRTNLADGNPFFSGDSATNTHSQEGGMQKKVLSSSAHYSNYYYAA